MTKNSGVYRVKNRYERWRMTPIMELGEEKMANFLICQIQTDPMPPGQLNNTDACRRTIHQNIARLDLLNTTNSTKTYSSCAKRRVQTGV